MRHFLKIKAQLRCLAALPHTLTPLHCSIRAPPRRIGLAIPLKRPQSLVSWRAAATTTTMSTLQQPNGNSSNELPPALPAEFDKTQFQHSITVKALRIPTQQCHHYMKLLVKYVEIYTFSYFLFVY